MAAELANEKKSIEEAAKNLREEKDTTESWVIFNSKVFLLYSILENCIKLSLPWSKLKNNVHNYRVHLSPCSQILKWETLVLCG